jgi:PAS domain S-box-containing protein
MKAFRDMPIKQKLMLILMSVTTASLLLAGLGIIVVDSLLFRESMQRDVAALGRIVADNSTAALSFDDAGDAADTLASLRARPHLVAACIYRADGVVFAQYKRPGEMLGCPQVALDEVRFTAAGLVLRRPIELQGRRIGTLELLYDVGEVSDRTKLYGSIVLGVLLISILIAYLLSTRLRDVIADPISQLVRATTSVSGTGDYSIRVQKLTGDELGVLVDRFNEMLAGIQSRDNTSTRALLEREAALWEAENARERFHFMAESMPQKIFTATPRGEVDYLNRQWTTFTGIPVAPLKSWDWTRFVHPDDLEASTASWQHSIETGEPFHCEHRFRRADGVYRWHLTRALAMHDTHGLTSMWLGSSTEIHEQKEKEEELRRANDDLQQFAYSASHDLQEPIRNVAVYSEIIAKRYHDILDAEGRQFLGFLTEGGRRLVTLINDLLAYTRAGVVSEETPSVDAAEVLTHTLADLAEVVRENKATVTLDPLPHVYMGEAHLQQVFQNLITNALKYRREDPPRIHVSAVNGNGAWRFSVQDNGIGIEPQYKEKIFGVFKRLHRDQKYSGTGIGLAICKRVVNRYGGRIWIESEFGKGTTVLFTVPQHPVGIPVESVESSTG